MFPSPPCTWWRRRLLHGRRVVGVSGMAPSTAANGTGKTRDLVVPTNPPYTPVGASLTYGSGSTRGLEVAVFGHWGEKILPTAPTGAIPYSTLTH